MASPVLEVRDLSVAYPGPRRPRGRGMSPPVVHGVSFDAGEREILALVGESGSGKSTIARTVMGLLEPVRGQVRFRGQELRAVGARDAELRRAVQMVFQDPGSSLNPRMSVGAIVSEGWRAHRAMVPAEGIRRGVATLLEQVGLDPAVASRRPGSLSGGQCQRVSIARALALQPQLLVCDEAVSALDISVQSQILRLLVDLRDSRGLSVLFITHDLAVVRQIADRVLVMRQGAIVETGQADAIFSAPVHEYTVGLLRAALELEGAV